MIKITILALDQSTKITGYSIFVNKELKSYGILISDLNETNPIERIKQMNDEVIALIKKTKPDFIVLEQIQFQRNQNVFQQLAQLQGVIMAYLFNINIGFTMIEPSAWKSYCGITGKKRDEQKLNTKKYIKELYGIDTSEDESDACAIGVWAINNIVINE